MKVTLLKHNLGIVVGWHLDPKKTTDNPLAERVLNYLPLVIFARMDGANFQLPGLPVGVYPFTPIVHTWTLNDKTGAKIHRKGFSMVSDFVSTAFMMQGS